MKASTVHKLCCPACRRPYEIRILFAKEDSVETAYLKCPDCRVTVPIVNGFPIFDEQFLTEPEDPDELSQRLFGNSETYLAFLDRKREKPVFDLYAAFQPFNESTQAIFPLVPVLQKVLKPGDLILDLWCRTGWTGELLAALFPEQKIVSVWEGPSGLLGLKGFHYWLGSGKRRENLDIIFHSPNNPLPFPTNTFSIVHGLDTLHRYRHMPLISECLRVVRQEGQIVFPHIHLTNSEPVPYFDRGETQLHGKQYQRYFEELNKGTSRKAFILSEKTLFEAGASYRLTDEADTDHYNACILMANKSNEGCSFERTEPEFSSYENGYVCINPLWRLDLIKGEAIPAPEAMAGGGSELFYRHPIYHARLLSHSPVHLDETDVLILYWANRLKSVSQIAGILRLDTQELFERLKKLEDKEIVQVQNISHAMAKLQFYYGNQQVPSAGKATLPELWNRTVLLHGEEPFLIWAEDNSIFRYEDADTIIRMAASFLEANGLQSGDRVLIHAISHPEFVFLFWGAVLLGAIVVPINPDFKNETIETILSRIKPKIVMIDPAIRSEVFSRTDAKLFPFGINEESPRYNGSFSQQIEDYSPHEDLPGATGNQAAVVLFTSGSTGIPKGVVLSHGALFRSSEIIDRAYRWRSSDRFLSGGSFHTMSGLRNPCIAVLHSGASSIIPGKDHSQSPLNLMSLCVKDQATILNVTPAFLAYWNRAANKVKYFQSHSLRIVLSTGSPLHRTHRETFEKYFNTRVYDYYGLTETSGACILDNEDLNSVEEKGIGRPWGCLVKIIDDEGNSLAGNKVGELAIYGENLMNGYFGEQALTQSRIRNGWFLTGDTARINDSGCVVLVGRKDRMMIDKNGENIYPEEIERALSDVPGVVEAYVTKYQDELMIDQIAALVHLDKSGSNQEVIMSNLKAVLSKRMASYHIPSLILPVEEIPKGSSGKVSSEAVRDVILNDLSRRRGI